MGDISNHDDVIDSRDVIERISELEAEIEGFEDKSGVEYDELSGELEKLKALESEAKGYAPDWRYGAALIRRSYWVDYVQELLQDIDDLPKGLPGYLVIDWEATARNIEADYTTVDFDGVEYLIR